MGPKDHWQPDSDDEYPDQESSGPIARLETTTASIPSDQDDLDSLQKLITLVHSATFRSTLTATFGVRDFAEIPSYQLARGNHFQIRKLARNSGVAKYPVIYGSDGVSRMSYEATALELQILLHAPVRKHHNIVDILSIGWTRLAPLKPPFLPIIYVEYAPNGTLAQYLEDNTLDPGVKNSFTQYIARGLQVLHSCGITHGDLKMDNVLIFPRSDGPYPVQAKLSDFGCSVLEDEHGIKLTGCTPPWNAPEWHENFSPSMLHVTDLYSLGFLVRSLTLNGKNPFGGQEADAIEARKVSDSVLEDAIQSIEQQYDTQMLLRGSIDDDSRFFTYLYSVAIPRRIFQNTLRSDPTKRDFQKVLESLSLEYYYGYAEEVSTGTKPKPEGQKVEDNKPVISFIRFFDAPNYVKSEVLECIKKVALDESGRNSVKRRAEASLQLCCAYIDGFGTPQDIHGALAWAEKAAELGSVSAGGLIKHIFESAGKPMEPDLHQRATEWQFKAVRSGLSIARDDLRQVDSDRCASAEEPFRIALGAEMIDNTRSPDLHFHLINGIFHPRNRAAQRLLHLQAGLGIGATPFLSLKKNTLFHAGAAMGVDIQHFESYLEEFSSPKYINAGDVAGNTPLHVGLRCNHSQHAKCILKHGADATITNNRGENPSHWLVYVDDPEEQQDLVDLLAKNGATFDAVAGPPSAFRDPYGFIRHGGTPLHWAVEKNMLEIVNKLLDHGADPEFIYKGSTPIDLAVERSNSEILQALLSKSKQPPVSVRVCTNPNASGSVKFMIAENYLNFAIGSLLLHDRWLFHGRAWVQHLRETIYVIKDFGLNLETEHSPMQIAALASTGSTEILELLVEEGFDDHPEGKAIFWQDLLHGCIRAGQPFALHFLFEQYAKYGSLKELSRPEELLLGSAESMNCDSSIMEKILETGVDINCRDKLRKSPLVLAVGSRNYELATFLLSRGADINAQYIGDEDHKILQNVLSDLIVSNRDIDLGPLKFLLEPLHPYVDKLPNFLVIPEQQGTAHHLACQTGNVVVVEFLLKKFPNKDQINFPDFNGWTALHHAAFNSHLEVVKMLCKAGADVNAQTGARDVPRRKRMTVLDFCFSWSAPSKLVLKANHGRQMTKEDVYLNRLHIADHLKKFDARRADRKLISRPQPLRFAFLAVIIENARLLSEALRRYDMPSIRQPILDALLFDAWKRQSTSVVQCLINAGANLNVRSKKSNTPLYIAATCGEPFVIHLLLQRGAEVNPVNDLDKTPLLCALKKKQPAAIRALNRAGGLVAMPRVAFNKVFTDMGIEPPNLSGAELPKFVIKIEGEPSESEDEGEPSESEDEGEPSESEDEGEPSESEDEGEPSESEDEGEPSESEDEGEPSESEDEGEPSESEDEGEPSESEDEGEPSESEDEGEPSESEEEGEPSESEEEGVEEETGEAGEDESIY